MSTDEVAEEPKRLEPRIETKRWLYVLSGNNCAFPECTQRLINEHGDWIGNHVHIRGVRGERFDPDMTNEQRRHRDNLLLMCYPHHVETNDEATWTADRLGELKRQHEARYLRGMEHYGVRELPGALTDLTRGQGVRHAENLRRMDHVLGWGHQDDELAETCADVNGLLDRLAVLPPPPRSVLGVLIDRGDRSRWTDDSICLPWPELAQVLGLADHELAEHLAILERHELVALDRQEDGRWPIIYTYKETLAGWPFWVELRAFCRQIDGGVSVADVLSSLDFTILDVPPAAAKEPPGAT